MNDVKIKKAKVKEDLFLEVEYSEDLPGHSKKDTKLSCTVPVHEDLKNAFDKLHVHMAILCDEVKAPKKKDFAASEFPDFKVRGFSIGGNDDHTGVTISGSKDGLYGLVNLNTPFTKYESSEYPFLSELAEDIQVCEHEVIQYLFEGKRAPEKQIEIDFEGEEQPEESQQQ
jgi:hypothetical protein